MCGYGLFLILFLSVIACSGCNSREGKVARPSDRNIRAVATTGMIADAVKRVGGKRVEVTGLMGPGVDPHLYRASEGDVALMAGSDIIFYNGLHLEGKMTDVFEQMGRIGKRAVAVTDHIDKNLLLAPPEFEGLYDPHVWFDVSLWMKVVERIRDALAEMDPGSAEFYASNAESYIKELSKLHDYVRLKARRVPESQRVLVTAHDAFNYFGRAYGFEVRGLQGISTATEAGAADVKALAEFIAHRKIRAIFIESSVPVRGIEALQKAVSARGFEVEIGGELFSDAMGDEGTPEGTYVGMVRHNIDTITGALMGSTARKQ